MVSAGCGVRWPGHFGGQGCLGGGDEPAGPEVSWVGPGPSAFSLALFSLPQMWKFWLPLALVAVAWVHAEVGERLKSDRGS
jgi:hypothetical protein